MYVCMYVCVCVCICSLLPHLFRWGLLLEALQPQVCVLRRIDATKWMCSCAGVNLPLDLPMIRVGDMWCTLVLGTNVSGGCSNGVVLCCVVLCYVVLCSSCCFVSVMLVLCCVSVVFIVLCCSVSVMLVLCCV